jgi:peptide deformylase
MSFELLHAPHEVLSTPALPVVAFDAALRELSAAMLQVMDTHPRGSVGLAAPQIGASLRLILVRETRQSVPYFFVNPEISDLKGEAERLEGCLSVPDREYWMPRASRLVLRAFTLDGRPVKMKPRDRFAQILQHEIDHLDGLLLSDPGRSVGSVPVKDPVTGWRIAGSKAALAMTLGAASLGSGRR